MIGFTCFKSNILVHCLEGHQYLNPLVHFSKVYLNYQFFKKNSHQIDLREL